MSSRSVLFPWGTAASLALAMSLMTNLAVAQSPPGGGRWGIASADLAANRIEFRLVNKYHQYQGTVLVIGYVKNLGGLFQAGAQARLYEVTNGQSKLVVQVPISSLAPGGEVKVAFSRNWFTQDSFRPDRYQLQVLVNPDVNDNAKNNIVSRSAADIDGLFQNSQRIQNESFGNSAGILRPIPAGPIGRRR